MTVRIPTPESGAINPANHDSSPHAADPVLIETGAVPASRIAGRVERGGVGRLARRIDGDDLVIPVRTPHPAQRQ